MLLTKFRLWTTTSKNNLLVECIFVAYTTELLTGFDVCQSTNDVVEYWNDVSSPIRFRLSIWGGEGFVLDVGFGTISFWPLFLFDTWINSEIIIRINEFQLKHRRLTVTMKVSIEEKCSKIWVCCHQGIPGSFATFPLVIAFISHVVNFASVDDSCVMCSCFTEFVF